MNPTKHPAPEPESPHVLDETQVGSLIAQLQYMLKHDVKLMKLEIVENIGAMLARRSGIDRELHNLAQRVDFCARAVDAFGARLAEVEKRLGIEPFQPESTKGSLGAKRSLTVELAEGEEA